MKKKGWKGVWGGEQWERGWEPEARIQREKMQREREKQREDKGRENSAERREGKRAGDPRKREGGRETKFY